MAVATCSRCGKPHDTGRIFCPDCFADPARLLARRRGHSQHTRQVDQGRTSQEDGRNKMTWRKFWEIGKKASEQFNTAALTMAILRIGGYLQIDWWYIAYWAVFSAVFGIVMSMCVGFCESIRDRKEVE